MNASTVTTDSALYTGRYEETRSEMNRMFATLIIGSVAVLLWNVLKRQDDRPKAVDRLRSAIANSNLPFHASDEMLALIEERRLRPSQFDDGLA